MRGRSSPPGPPRRRAATERRHDRTAAATRIARPAARPARRRRLSGFRRSSADATHVDHPGSLTRNVASPAGIANPSTPLPLRSPAGHDHARLADRRRDAGVRAVRLLPGFHRRRPVAGRVRRRGDRRHAAGRRAAGGRSRIPLRAAVRADRRPGRRRDPGDRLRGCRHPLARGLRLPFLGLADGLLGALLSAAVALTLAWILGVVVLALPGTGALRNEIRRSSILRRLDELLPPSGVVLHALARIDPLPAIAGVGSSIAPPPLAPPRRPQWPARSAASFA